MAIFLALASVRLAGEHATFSYCAVVLRPFFDSCLWNGLLGTLLVKLLVVAVS